MNHHASRIDPEFTALPLRDLADAALAQAKTLGAQHADFRAERIRGQRIGLSDGTPQTLFDADDTGLAVRVIVDGTWGFASAVDLTADAAALAARQAVEVAKVAAAMNTEPIELAPEPGYGDVTWVSAYDVDPFTVSVPDKVALLAQWSADVLAARRGQPRGRLAEPGQGVQVLRRRRHHRHPAAGPAVPVRHRRRGHRRRQVRHHADARPARRARV